MPFLARTIVDLSSIVRMMDACDAWIEVAASRVVAVVVVAGRRVVFAAETASALVVVVVVGVEMVVANSCYHIEIMHSCPMVATWLLRAEVVTWARFGRMDWSCIAGVVTIVAVVVVVVAVAIALVSLAN